MRYHPAFAQAWKHADSLLARTEDALTQHALRHSLEGRLPAELSGGSGGDGAVIDEVRRGRGRGGSGGSLLTSEMTVGASPAPAGAAYNGGGGGGTAYTDETAAAAGGSGPGGGAAALVPSGSLVDSSYGAFASSPSGYVDAELHRLMSRVDLARRRARAARESYEAARWDAMTPEERWMEQQERLRSQ